MFYGQDKDLIEAITIDLSGMNSNRFFTPKEGFLRGNMFKDEYKPYKNLTYLNLIPKNEKETLLLKVCEYDFAINDLGLYLDFYSEDNEAFSLFKIYKKEYEKAKLEYENKYGPLSLEDTADYVYNWVDNPWPWDKEGGTYHV